MVDWSLARQIAHFAAGGGAAPIEADFPALVDQSERALHDYTGLKLAGPIPPPEPVGRAEWADVNLDSLAALLAPVTERLSERLGSTGAFARPPRAVPRATPPAQAGPLVGHP